MITLESKKLEQLSNDSQFLVLDTCAVLGTYDTYGFARTDKSLETRKIKIESAINTLNYFLYKFHEVNNLFMTKKIYSELEGFSFSPTQIEKFGKRYRHFFPTQEGNYIEAKEMLLDGIDNRRKVLGLSKREKNMHEELSQRYFQDKIKFKLSNQDYDLFISALVLYKNRGTTTIISNDNGIKRLWNKLLPRNLDSKKRFQFYNHQSLGNFVSAQRNY